MSYQPLKITGYSTGLVQSREEFLLPDDAYPVLINAWIFRERILRKRGYELLGRLQRNFTGSSLGNDIVGSTTIIANAFATLSIPETNPQFVPGSVVITVGGTDGASFTDTGSGTFTATGKGLASGSSINYITGKIVLRFSPFANGGQPITVNFSYYPNLPVMGIRTRENANSINDQTIFFDTTYAYDFNSSLGTFEQFLAPTDTTTWTGTNSEFFWTTNYFIDKAGNKIFWTTNYSASQDPIRYTNGQTGTTWQNFTPQIDQAVPNPNFLWQAKILIPFRGRLVAFNTSEGTVAPGIRYTNRIRWAAIGTPFTVNPGPPVDVQINTQAWLDNIRGQGGFLDIPTSEDIVSVGFVRDNLVIYCENSTWQLRYTGRSIAPFQIEKVNSELGALSTFSGIQFDTSLVGIGDKGIVECDSYKSELIDVKIPDFVFDLRNLNNGPERIQGVRDFINRICFWTVCTDPSTIYPDARLVYNYDNDSWAIFTDSLTALGTFQLNESPRWIDVHVPWKSYPYPWISTQNQGVPDIVGGNQQGFILNLDQITTNDSSLFIQNITGNSPNPTSITCPNHNLTTGQIISISGIPASTPFANLNGGVFYVIVTGVDTFTLFTYDPGSQQFSIPQADAPGVYAGSGLIAVRDNFNITSKKFNFLDEGQNIEMGYFDILLDATEQANPGAISVNVYLDYNDTEAINTLPENSIEQVVGPAIPDGFFNQVIPTSQSSLNNIGGTKFWQRVYCASRASFITLQYTFSNAQMAGIEQTLGVQIDAQVLWIRKAGVLSNI